MLIARRERLSAAPSGRGNGVALELLAVAALEWKLALRNTNAPLLATFTAAACILFTPPADAGYAVITFGGMTPVLSAGTSVVAAGIGLSLILFPVCLLVLGLGCSRDRRLGTGAMIAGSPVEAFALAAGRVAANLGIVTALSLVALCLASLSTASRFHSVPDAVSVAAFLLLVMPVALCAVPIAALLDRYLGDSDGSRTTAALTLWLALLVCGVLAGPDLFGFDLLRRNTPAGLSPGDFSAGVVIAANMRKIPWLSVAAPPEFVLHRLLIAAAAIFAGVFVSMQTASGLKPALLPRPTSGRGASAAGLLRTMQPLRMRAKRSGAIKTAWIVAGRWFNGARWTWALSAASLLTAIAFPGSPRVAVAIALLAPLTIVNRRRICGDSNVRELEQTTAAFWTPAPLLFTSFLLTAVTALPMLPLLLALPPLRCAQLVAAIAVAAQWLTWTCAAQSRPLLGISVYSLFWYLEIFCDLPSWADLFGLSASSAPSFSCALGIGAILSILLLGKESHALRSSGNI